MADGKVVIETDLDTSGFKTGLSKLGNLAKSGIKATTTAIAAAGTALAGLGGVAVKIGADFEEGMSKVESISGATAEEMQKLTNKAKEMGAKTKFSATESAEAFQYMAMAGWKTGDMLDGIEGIMNLAAASGEDLANVSDIVTDALTAFGLQAKDSAHFADVLAKASSSSNTNVAMMGATFKYAAPVAGALGYKIEDVAVAVGLMANAGIKGEMAGTVLRGTLTNLAKPTDQVQKYMDALKVSMTNAKGEVKPLNQLMEELRTAFSGLTDAQKAEYAAGIAGKEAMSGLLAIVNASDDDFAKLTEEINNCNGATKEMAEVRLDNLKGQLTILKSGLEGLAIEFYESVENPLKSVVKTAQDMVGQLSQAFKKDGINGLVTEFGNVFSQMATKAAQSAPKLIEAGKNMILAFLQGIQKNSGKLARAAVEIGKSFLKALLEIIPQVAQAGMQIMAAFLGELLGSDIGNAAKQLAQTMGEAFQSVLRAASSIASELQPILTAMAKVVLSIANAVLPPLTKAIGFLADNAGKLVPLLASVVAGFVAWKAVKTVSSIVTNTGKAVKAFSTIQTAFGLQMAISTKAVTLQQVAVGVLTGKIKLATVAQAAWGAITKAFKSPLTWVITGVAALAAGIVALCLRQDEETKRHKKAMKVIEDEKKARQELIEEQQEQLNTNLAEIDNTQRLAQELKTLVDENGRVKEGYEERVAFITNELSSALGQEIQVVNGVIQGYQNLTTELSGTLNANKSLKEELDSLVGANGRIKDGEQKRAEVLASQLNKALGTNLEVTGNTIKNYGELSGSIDKQIGKNQDLVKELGTLVDENGNVEEKNRDRVQFILGELSQAMGVEIEMIDGQIQGYQGLADSIDKVIAKQRAQAILDAQYEIYKNALEQKKKATERYVETQKKLADAELDLEEKKAVSLANINDTHLYTIYKSAEKAAEKKIKSLNNELNEEERLILQSNMDIASYEKNSVRARSDNMKDLAKIEADILTGAAQTAEEKLAILEVQLQGEQDALKEMEKMYADSNDEFELQQIESQKAQVAITEQLIEEQKQAIENGIPGLVDAVTKLGEQGILAMQPLSVQVATIAGDIAVKAQKGIKDGEPAVITAAKAVINAAIIAMKGPVVGTVEIGAQLALGVVQGIKDKQKKAIDAAVNMAVQAAQAMKDFLIVKSPSRLMRDQIGKNIALGVAAGIDQNAKKAAKSAQELGELVLQSAAKTLSNYQVYHDTALADEVAFWGAVRKQVKNGTQAKIDADKKYLDSKKELDDQLLSLDQGYASKTRQVHEDLKKDVSDLVQSYNDQVDSRTKSIVSSMNLFSAFEKKDTDGEELLDNLQGQVDALTDWTFNLHQLKKRGLNKDLLSELEQMGVSASGEIEALLSLSDKQLKEYSNLWKEKNKLAKEQAVSELAPLKGEISQQIAELTRQANEDLASYNQEYVAAMEELGVTMQQPIEQLKTIMLQDGSVIVGNFSNAMLESTQNAETIAKFASLPNAVQAATASLPGAMQSLGAQTVDSYIAGMLSKEFDVRAAVAQLRAAVMAEQARVGAVVTSGFNANVVMSTQGQGASNTAAQAQPSGGIMEAHLYVDGREAGIAVAPYVSKELAFAHKF